MQDDDKGSVFSLARSQLLNPLYEGPRGGQKNPLYEGGADGPKPEDPHLFSFEQLAAASDNFSAERLLGGSGFGRVYLCAIEGRSLVVKRLNDLQVRVSG